MKTWERRSRKSSKVIRGDHFSEVILKGGSAKFHFVQPQILQPPPPPTPPRLGDKRVRKIAFFGLR